MCNNEPLFLSYKQFFITVWVNGSVELSRPILGAMDIRLIPNNRPRNTYLEFQVAYFRSMFPYFSYIYRQAHFFSKSTTIKNTMAAANSSLVHYRLFTPE